jgi:phosphoglycolate phosphatase
MCISLIDILYQFYPFFSFFLFFSGRLIGMDYSRIIPDRFRLYVFDLDGTLVDSLEDLCLSVNWVLARKSYPEVDRETVRRAVGNGARNLLARTFASAAEAGGRDAPSGAELDGILAEYRARYEAHCAEHTALYPGIRDWLESLRARGLKLAVLTNKPERATRALLDALKVSGYFMAIAGPETFGATKPDPAGLKAIMRLAGAGLSETVMIGDSSVDVETARNAGVACCGITGGLGDSSAMLALRPEYVIERG